MRLLLPALVMSRIWVRQRACCPPPWHPGCHPALLNHFAIFSLAKNLPRLNSSSYLMVCPHVAFQIQACNVSKLGMQDAILKMLLSCDFETPCASRFPFFFYLLSAWTLSDTTFKLYFPLAELTAASGIITNSLLSQRGRDSSCSCSPVYIQRNQLIYIKGLCKQPK